MSSADTVDNMTGLEIAIIGMALRFPGAKSADQFWQNLRDGVESISFFSDKELLEAGIDPALLSHPRYVKAKGAIEDIDLFDASFFGFNPREAEIMDPQHRLFLECSWEALENAGYNSETYKGLVGIYAGVAKNRYQMNIYLTPGLVEATGDWRILIGNEKDPLTTRVAYKLNLRGPAITVQTTCSTSLVAVHLACRALLGGECDIALAGGVSIGIPQKSGSLYQEGEVASPDGHCRAFDARAEGTIGGDGVGIVVLKRLADALADGDSIDAVIKGSAINNDGASKVSYTAPSVDGQADAIRAALLMADVKPETITYVEAHGTGTALGDPIEIAALVQAFRAEASKKKFCAIGSVKTNVGHLDTAAGVAGLIKTVLALKHKLIPPSLHFERPNPKIDFENSPFYVNSTLSDWRASGSPRRAGVSSFGIGGTNAHVVLEEAPPVESSVSASRWQVLPLSGKTPSALESATNNIAEHLKSNPDLNLPDVAYTLQAGRKAFPHRRMLVSQDVADAARALESRDAGRVFTSMVEAGDKSVVFMFPGQGAQYVMMGRELYETEPRFYEWVNHYSEQLKPHLGLDLRDLIFPGPDQVESASRQLNQTFITQPALFVISYALSQLWQAWGVRPQAMIGHSIGEYVAACIAGVLSLEDALMLVALRGRMMQSLPGGSLLAVDLSEEELRPLLGSQLSLAAANAPSLSVVSGPFEAVEALRDHLTRRGVDCRALKTSHAFHSQMMDALLEPFAEQVRKINLHAPKIPYLSNVTGTWITTQEATDPGYWAVHLRQTVLFSAGMSELLKDPSCILLEVGPGRTLSALAKKHKQGRSQRIVLSSLPHRQAQESDVKFLHNTLGRLWLAGAEVNWSSVHANGPRSRVHLPTYPFERQRYWVEPPRPLGGKEQQINLALQRNESQDQAAERLLHNDRKRDIADWFYVPVWKQSISYTAYEPADPAKQRSSWLLFMDSCGLGVAMESRLRSEGRVVTSVLPGERFQQIDDCVYALNPRERDDYDLLLLDLKARGKMPNKIVHLWNVTPSQPAQPGVEDSQEFRHKGFYSLLFLAQAMGDQVLAQTIGKQDLADAFDLAIVSNDMQDVIGEEDVCPEKAVAIGPFRVISQEYPNINCRSIDVVLPKSGTPKEQRLVDQLLAEMTIEPSDMLVAYRGRYRWVQTYEPVRFDGEPAPPARLRDGGVYLITGGMGGVGLELAEYLARTVQAKLILVGRSAFPQREEWETWLTTHDEMSEVSRKIRKLQAIEELGAEVLIRSADVAIEDEMRVVMREAYERFGTVHGVIHAAGLPPGSIIQRKSPEAAASVLAPKVEGTRVLDAIFKGRALDFMLLCSSLRSITGGPGAIDYCAANAFLDAFAHHHHSRGDRYTISVNWDGWREVGMGATSQEQRDSVSADSTDADMSSLEGVEVFRRVLFQPFPQVIVSTHDLHSVIAQKKALSASMAWEQLESLELPKSSYPRPQLDNPYVAPVSEVEQTLADIWQRLLGIEPVGIHDNFFELGGDSIISIQVIARANQAGLQITPRQVFEHQTIAKLAAVVGMARSVSAEQGLVIGSVPLTPIQQRFFEQHLPAPHHYNQALLLEAREQLSPVLLNQVVKELLVRHDALRLRFTQEASGWQQVHAGPDEIVPFTLLDLSALPESERALAIESAAAEFQTSLSLSKGPLLRVVLFNLGANTSSRLLIIIHHLVIDAISWRILLEDLQTAYQQIMRGEPIELPLKTLSFKQWANHLLAHAQSDALMAELPYWLDESRKQVSRLPRDFEDGDNTVASARGVIVSLNPEETRALLQDVPRVHNAQISDLLLAALVRGFARWTGGSSLLVAMEGHGREALFEDVDLSRSVGWFTTVFPVMLEMGDDSNPESVLITIKNQLRRVPNRGIGYGMLRYMSGDVEIAEKLRSLPQAEVSFLYLGQLDQVLSPSAGFVPARESIGPTQDVKGARSHLLQFNASIFEGRLQLEWVYSENIHRRATIQELAQHSLKAIESLIAHCPAFSREGDEASNPLRAQSAQTGLDRIIESSTRPGRETQARAIERVPRKGEMPLSFPQQRLWLLDQLEPGNTVYNMPEIIVLSGELKVMPLDQTLSQVVRRHEVLRTTFKSVDGQPFQVIALAKPLALAVVDLSGLCEAERESEAKRLSREEAQRSFNLARGPLLRASLLRLDKLEHRVLFTMHHIVSDGWSVGVLMREVTALYEAFARGEPSPLPELAIQYIDFAIWQRQWLKGERLQSQLSYWKRQLDGIPASLNLHTDRPRPPVQTYSGATQSFVVPASLTQDLKMLSRQEGVTLFMTLLAVFQTLLHRYSGQDDIVVGSPIANRNPAETEELIGCFMNTLALRARLAGNPTFRELLASVREVTVGAYTNKDLPFESIVENLRLDHRATHSPVFQVWFVLHNYTLQPLKLPGLTLGPSGADIDAAMFDLALLMREMEQGLVGTLNYNTDLFNATTIAEMSQHFIALLRGVTADPRCHILDIELISEDTNTRDDSIPPAHKEDQMEDHFVF